jgi:hypothetical protein
MRINFDKTRGVKFLSIGVCRKGAVVDGVLKRMGGQQSHNFPYEVGDVAHEIGLWRLNGAVKKVCNKIVLF